MRHRPFHPGTAWTLRELIPDLPGERGWGVPNSRRTSCRRGRWEGSRFGAGRGASSAQWVWTRPSRTLALTPCQKPQGTVSAPPQGLLWQLWGLGGGDRVTGGHTLRRLKRRHPALGVCVAGAVLESPNLSTPLSQLSLSQGTSRRLAGLQWGEGTPASGAAPLAPLEIEVDLGLASAGRACPGPTSLLQPRPPCCPCLPQPLSGRCLVVQAAVRPAPTNHAPPASTWRSRAVGLRTLGDLEPRATGPDKEGGTAGGGGGGLESPHPLPRLPGGGQAGGEAPQWQLQRE